MLVRQFQPASQQRRNGPGDSRGLELFTRYGIITGRRRWVEIARGLCPSGAVDAVASRAIPRIQIWAYRRRQANVDRRVPTRTGRTGS